MGLGGTGAPGQSYSLQGTTNLAPVNWIPRVTNTADGSGVFQFPGSQATNYLERYYRLRTQ
jgi:hypothetical protein